MSFQFPDILYSLLATEGAAHRDTDIHASRNSLLVSEGAAHGGTGIHASINTLLASEGAAHRDTDIHAAKTLLPTDFLKRNRSSFLQPARSLQILLHHTHLGIVVVPL